VRKIIVAGMVLPLAALGVSLSVAASGPVRSVDPAGGEHPPECVPVRFANPDGTVVHVQACGFGSLGESWAVDAAKGSALLVDGAYLRGRGCGSVTAPCVVFWTGSPTEGHPVGEGDGG